jgi:hypothetical protein
MHDHARGEMMDEAMRPGAALTALGGRQSLRQIGGGMQTAVFLSADGRHVIKVPTARGGPPRAALARARAMRVVAREFAAYLGGRHTIPTWYAVVADAAGLATPLAIQPFVARARPLAAVDFAALDPAERAAIARQLDTIVRRAQRCYRATGHLPDLHGRSRLEAAGPLRPREIHLLPRRLWLAGARRTLLRSHNLLLTDAPEHRVILVDYDLAFRHPLARRAYFAVRHRLLPLDRWLIRRLHQRGAASPRRRRHRPAPHPLPGRAAPAGGAVGQRSPARSPRAGIRRTVGRYPVAANSGAWVARE